jgi:hypothetical protein
MVGLLNRQQPEGHISSGLPTLSQGGLSQARASASKMYYANPK